MPLGAKDQTKPLPCPLNWENPPQVRDVVRGPKIKIKLRAEEAVIPYQAFTAAGHEIVVATPGGVVPLLDQGSLAPSSTAARRARRRRRARSPRSARFSTPSLEDVDLDCELNLAELVFKRASVHGTALRSRPTGQKAAIVAEVQGHVWPLVENGSVQVVIDRTLPTTEAAEAHRILGAHHIGKIVLVNPDTA
ncbi:zinc-binding dehydrogenase [Streptomyces sp. NPDC020681]|uniref:zinc-binding dehydrogenase n=1 Tax=Streptomyces sp. NPDC020681 TaxID=3365083 RepID=UPI0037A80424